MGVLNRYAEGKLMKEQELAGNQLPKVSISRQPQQPLTPFKDSGSGI